jgi:PAS domain S-box-containing protein
VACLRDVTAQRSDARARQRSESLYTRLVDSATDAIFTVDLEGRFTSVNPAFLNEAGLARDQVLGQHFVALVDPVDRREAEQAMLATLGGERQRMQLRCLGAQGSRLTMVTSAPIHDQSQVVGALGIVRDITNEEVQREARGQQARLAAIGQSLGRVANELNNPLASLLALAELQVDSPTLHSDDRQALQQMLAEARRASVIVGQLMEGGTASASEGDQGDRVPINTVVRRALELHGYSLRSARVRVTSELGANVPDVDGDPLQLQQVVSNLILNAEQALTDHSGERDLRVSTRVEQGHVVIEVIDSGPGIAAQDLPRVIEPMFTTRAHRGQRGLGLTIAHAIVREHGGWMAVQSTYGAGVTVVVRLPLAAPGDAACTSSPDRVNTLTPGGTVVVPDSSYSPGGRAVLLIEDEMTLRTTISRFLRSLGYTVDLAGGGAAALELLATHDYDAILLDLRMNGMTGEQVYTAIETQYTTQVSQVIFMTGDLHSETSARFVRNTGRPVLPKPFTLQDVATIVGAVAAGRRETKSGS